MRRFLDYYRPRSRITSPYIKTNSSRAADPSFRLDGTNTPQELSNFLMFSSTDPSYVGASTALKPGMTPGAAAVQGDVVLIDPTLTGNTVIFGSDTSMPSIGGLGWRHNVPLNGVFSASNWLISLVLYGQSTAGGARSIAVIPGVRFWYGSDASVSVAGGYLPAFSTATPQYHSTSVVFVPGASASVFVQWSVSLGSALGAGTVFVLSGQYMFEEVFLKLGTLVNAKMNVQVGENG